MRACVHGSCHKAASIQPKLGLPEEAQRELASIVLVGLVSSVGSGGLGAIAATGRAIAFSSRAQVAALRASAVARQHAQTTWVVTSDLSTRVVVATAPGLMSPVVQQRAIKFSQGFFEPGPLHTSPTGFGPLGSSARLLVDRIVDQE